MAIAKKGLATWATVSTDICVCGHAVSAHNASEVCRFCTHPDQRAGVGACVSIRTER